MDKLSICNSALIRCGASTIQSLEDSNKQALIVNKQYDFTLREMLNDTTWNFAISRITLEEGEPPLYGYNSSYELPADCIRVLEVENAIYKIEGRKLLTDSETTINIKYIKNVTDTELFSPSFTKAFILKLAEDISYSLVQSAALQGQIASDAERYLRKARSYNSQEGTPESRYPESFVGSERL